jgi:hypothetical protein
MTIDDLIKLAIQGKEYLEKQADTEEVKSIQKAVNDFANSKEAAELNKLIKK